MHESVNGTKRNCQGAHGISGAEGRPAAPSAWRRQPPLTKADLTKTREDRLSVQARRNDRVVPARIRRADYHGYRCVMHHETFAATATLSIRAQRQLGYAKPARSDRVGEVSVDVAAWLHGLGLQQYEQAICDKAIETAVLPELTADDLKDLGVSLVGHRRKLLAAIAALRSDIGPTPDTPVAASAAERRQLTVMFCDLVGSSELASGSLPV